MTPTRRTSARTSGTLPPPTPSEAAFEKLLRAFDEPALDAAAPSDDVAAFVQHAFANGKTYLQRDPFERIGEADVFRTKVVGVSFEGRQDQVAGLLPGHELELRRHPENPVDPNAIGVHFGIFHIGYLRAGIAKHIAARMDEGTSYRAVIEHVTGGAEKFRGVNIRVERIYERVTSSMKSAHRVDADADAVREALIGDAQFHATQRAVLGRLEQGRNTLAVFGTGRGKSLCFQYPAVLRALQSGQKTLVLYPLRALANDQFDALSRRLESFGLRIFRANGSIAADERALLMDALERGDWDMVLATPEFLQFHQESFTRGGTPALVVVDETHHVYESKHRPAYGNLANVLLALGNPQVLALTATADGEAFAQIVRDLRIDAWVIDPTVRANLQMVDARETRDKLAYLFDLFGTRAGKGIVYCNSRTEATKVAESLRRRFGDDVVFYHAGMPSAERTLVENYFRSGALRIVVATSAFGEGIDLPDVRSVVLYHLNFDFTEFNQQSGRAGRDGEPAQIHLLFGQSDRRINEYIIDRQAPTLPLLREIYKGARSIASQGVLRASFADIGRTLALDKADERTIATAVRIFEDERLVETGFDDDGRFIRFLPVDGKIDMARNERFAEGEAMRENFAKFADFVLSAKVDTLERIVNRPIYPERVELLR